MDADEKEDAEKEQEAAQEPAESSEDQPATLKKAQDAAAARKDGEEVGSSGKNASSTHKALAVVLFTHAFDLLSMIDTTAFVAPLQAQLNKMIFTVTFIL